MSTNWETYSWLEWAELAKAGYPGTSADFSSKWIQQTDSYGNVNGYGEVSHPNTGAFARAFTSADNQVVVISFAGTDELLTDVIGGGLWFGKGADQYEALNNWIGERVRIARE